MTSGLPMKPRWVESPYASRRRETFEVRVGDVGVGAGDCANTGGLVGSKQVFDDEVAVGVEVGDLV